jgi:hypothetical protein
MYLVSKILVKLLYHFIFFCKKKNDKYPLQGAKKDDFHDFCKIVKLMEIKGHLTDEGVAQIKNIKSRMNLKRV